MRVVAVTAVILVATNCAPNAGLVAGHADISGGPYVLGEGRRPASGTDLTIVSRAGEVSHAKVNRRGVFHARLAPGRYRIWVTGWPHEHPRAFTVRSGATTDVTLHLSVR